MQKKISLIITIILVFSTVLLAQSEQKKGKNPIIVIPGILGSKLVNKETKEVVWVKFSGSKDDDLRLPISTNLIANKDNLIATELIDKVRITRFLPGISVYENLLDYLEKKMGYRRGSWDIPLSADYEDSYYVFPYDWRRDNVETAHLLLQKIEKLKAKLNKPDLKFDVVAHSMGGLVARYAAMYGASDLKENPQPNWLGAKHFNKVFMMGTPNEGSMSSLESLYNGYWIDTIRGRYYPEFLSREVSFTIPSIYQLLPHGKSAKFYDDRLNPLSVDIYNINTWKKYGWGIISDKEYLSKQTKAERLRSEKYLELVLLRAKRFHEALDVKTIIPPSLTFLAYGSDCKNTLDGAIIYYNSTDKVWETLMQGNSFTNGNGKKVSDKLVKEKILAKGDGTVPITSLLAENVTLLTGQSLFLTNDVFSTRNIVCEGHTAIPGNKKVQESFSEVLLSSVIK